MPARPHHDFGFRIWNFGFAARPPGCWEGGTSGLNREFKPKSRLLSVCLTLLEVEGNRDAIFVHP
jgi:hypothetical protein